MLRQLEMVWSMGTPPGYDLHLDLLDSAVLLATTVAFPLHQANQLSAFAEGSVLMVKLSITLQKMIELMCRKPGGIDGLTIPGWLGRHNSSITYSTDDQAYHLEFPDVGTKMIFMLVWW